MTVKDRMSELGMKQVDMIFALRERGYDVQPPFLSATLSGVLSYPRSKEVLTECEKILDEREQQVLVR